MAHASEVCVWFPAMKLDALKEELGRQGTTVEVELLAKLEDLYERTVLLDRRVEIGAALAEQDRLAAEEDARRKAENYRVSAFRIYVDGREEYWKLERVIDILLLAKMLRTAIRQKEMEAAAYFLKELKSMKEKEPIVQGEFDALSTARLNGDIHVVGAYELDFDRQTLTIAEEQNCGWKSYRFKDISTAIYKADRKPDSWKNVLGRFEKELAGKELSFKLCSDVLAED